MIENKNEPTNKTIDFMMISHSTSKIVLPNVYMVLIPSLNQGMIGILRGHEKMLILLEAGDVKCIAGDGNVVGKYRIEDGIARIDEGECSIISSKIQALDV